jgi:hypothetical protein
MCDYSLAGVPNRLAVEGEELVVHRFQTGALGLASLHTSLAQSWFSKLWSARVTPAVCVPPGTRLLLRDIPAQLRIALGVSMEEQVTFVQQSAEAYQYRDAVRFQNGREILLQRLRCSQRVDVLSLSSSEFDSEARQRFEEGYRRVSQREVSPR